MTVNAFYFFRGRDKAALSAFFLCILFYLLVFKDYEFDILQGLPAYSINKCVSECVSTAPDRLGDGTRTPVTWPIGPNSFDS